MSVDAGAQVVSYLLACGPGEVIVIVLDRFCIWVELLVQRRLCPIFVSDFGYLTFTSIPRVDGLSTDTPVLGRHKTAYFLSFCCSFLFLIDLRVVLERIFISIEEISVLYLDIQFIYC